MPWQLKSGHFAYEINLDTMTQKNLESGTVRHIRRVGPGETASKTAPTSDPMHKSAQGAHKSKRIASSAKSQGGEVVDASSFKLSDDVLAQVFLWLDTLTLLTVVPAVCRSWSKILSLMTDVTLTLTTRTGGIFTPEKPAPFSPAGQQIMAGFVERFARVTAVDLSGTYKSTWEDETSETNLDFIPKLFPNLAIIRLQGCTWVSNKEVLFLAEIPSIVGVDVFGCHVYQGAELKLVERKPQLKVFGGNCIDSKKIMAIADGCTSLTSVALSLEHGPPPDFLPLAKHGATLKSLTIGGCADHLPAYVDPEALKILPNLVFITLMYVRNAPAVVKAAVESCHRMQSCTVVKVTPLEALRLLEGVGEISTIRLHRFDRDVVGKRLGRWDVSFALHVHADTDAEEMVEKWPRGVLDALFKNGGESSTFLRILIEEGYTSAVKAFLSIGHPPSPNSMMLATVSGHLDVIEVLLQANAAVDEPWEEGGASALAVATYYGHLDVMRLLIAHGADVNRPSAKNDGDTPLTIVKRSDDNEAKKILGIKTQAGGSNWKYPTEAEMALEAFTHLGTPQSAVTLSEFDGIGSRWFSFQRDEWGGETFCHPDCRDLEGMDLVRTDLMHRSFSELPDDVRDIASQLEAAVANLTVGAGDGESSVAAVVFSGNTSDVRTTCLRALGIKRPAWRWSTLDEADYSSMAAFDGEYEIDEEDEDDVNNMKTATQILANSLVEHFVFTFSDPPVYICPKLYGGRHEESGCIVALLVTRDHGD